MEEKALQPGNTVPAALDKRPDFSLTDFKEGRVFEWLTGLKSGYQQAMEGQALADLAKEVGLRLCQVSERVQGRIESRLPGCYPGRWGLRIF